MGAKTRALPHLELFSWWFLDPIPHRLTAESRAARWLAGQHRRGGLAGLHRQLAEALEALDRIEGGQAFALEEQATAWRRVGWGDRAVAPEGDGC